MLLVLYAALLFLSGGVCLGSETNGQAICYPLGTRRVMNVRWTSYLGPSDVNYWRTSCGRKISTSYKRNFWTQGKRSFFVVTFFERPKDVLIQKFFERWISTSFGRVILDMTNHDCWLNVVSKRRLNVRNWRYLDVILWMFPDQEGRHLPEME